MNNHYLFDFQDLLFDFTSVSHFFRTGQGRSFLEDNVATLNVTEHDSLIRKIMWDLASHNKVSIVSNTAPAIIHGTLKRFGYPEVPVFAPLYKPAVNSFLPEYHRLLSQVNSREDMVVVGASSVDILFSHALCIPSIAAAWSKKFPVFQLNQAEPSRFAMTPTELLNIIESCEVFGLEYMPQQNIFDYEYFNPSNITVPESEIIHTKENLDHHLTDYYPWGHEMFYQSESGRILIFKRISERGINKEEIESFDAHFYNGCVRLTERYCDVFSDFLDRMLDYVSDMRLQGSIGFIAAPNSLPDYCYRSDPNQLLAQALTSKYNGSHDVSDRRIRRVKPKCKNRRGHRTSLVEHLGSMGIPKYPTDMTKYLANGPDNIILIDDIATEGTQLWATLLMIKSSGYQGNTYGLVLGKTKH